MVGGDFNMGIFLYVMVRFNMVGEDFGNKTLGGEVEGNPPLSKLIELNSLHIITTYRPRQ
jgi:hypothetical protein